MKQVGKVLEAEVFATIANDYNAAISSVNVGEPLVLSKTQSRIMQDFAHLASKLSGIGMSNEGSENQERQSRPGWRTLFGARK
jgi:septum formation inhibitor-activating ATPase MinD